MAIIKRHDFGSTEHFHRNPGLPRFETREVSGQTVRRLQPVFFFSSRRRHTRSVSAFLLNRSSDLFNRPINILCRVSLFLSMALCLLLRLFVFRLLRLKRFSTLTLKVL